ncbi:site-2 protease family protein [Thermonema sp.]|uniref:site-2 protease family protein n=1 Tax=Thermonema sp. TaxID=2231181 RepID=UPI002582F3CE|nr:site-2 protease family protein [Thermonema sp.]
MKYRNRKTKGSIHLLLFVLTFITTTIAGAEWIHGKPLIDWSKGSLAEWVNSRTIGSGLHYSLPLLLALSFHEFGHYFTARHYHIRVTLPYYLPFWFFDFSSSIGTMGAFIRIKERMRSRKQFFDVGIAGPLAGFVVGLGILYYGYTHLPPRSYVLEIHPEYKTMPGYQVYGDDYSKYAYQADSSGTPKLLVSLQKPLLFMLAEHYWVEDNSRIPDPREMMHYPYLLAAYIVMLFTALNLVPIGQLDGGHILYGLLGPKVFNRIALILFYGFLYYAGLGLVSPYTPFPRLFVHLGLYVYFLYLCFYSAAPLPSHRLTLALSVVFLQFATLWLFPKAQGYNGWLVFIFILGRFLGIYHPTARVEAPIGTGRQLLGWLSLLILVLCFLPAPFQIEVIGS